MPRRIVCIPVLITLFILPTLLLASDETLTITTYYPSPYGVYNEMRSKRIAIGDDYINNADYAWELADGDGGQVDYLADLVVEGNVGIGTTSPAEKLEVSGNIKLSGASATYKITNVANPTAAQDVATKAYVDAAAGGGPGSWTCTTRSASQSSPGVTASCLTTEKAISGYCYYSGGTMTNVLGVGHATAGLAGWYCDASQTGCSGNCYWAYAHCCK